MATFFSCVIAIRQLAETLSFYWCRLKIPSLRSEWHSKIVTHSSECHFNTPFNSFNTTPGFLQHPFGVFQQLCWGFQQQFTPFQHHFLAFQHVLVPYQHALWGSQHASWALQQDIFSFQPLKKLFNSHFARSTSFLGLQQLTGPFNICFCFPTCKLPFQHAVIPIPIRITHVSLRFLSLIAAPLRAHSSTPLCHRKCWHLSSIRSDPFSVLFKDCFTRSSFAMTLKKMERTPRNAIKIIS